MSTTPQPQLDSATERARMMRSGKALADHLNTKNDQVGLQLLNELTSAFKNLTLIILAGAKEKLGV